MATLQDFRDERLKKLEKLRSLGIDPFPARVGHIENRRPITEITTDFDELAGQRVTVAGRIVGIRKFGKIAFFVVKDFSGEMQLFMSGDHVEPLNSERGTIGMNELNLLDTGDFVAATGELIRTKTGEISVDVVELQLLTKALRPMPDRQGFTNKDERMRRRYIDMNVNGEVRDRFIRRSKFWQANRDFLNKNGFIEINTSVLEHTTGGADANPFRTHMDALGQDFYLRISHELPLKRLLGAGYEKVYDIGPRFRNENYSDEHLPEHVAMEWYAAYWDWQDGRDFMEEMYKYMLQETFGTLQFKIRGFDIDMSSQWEVKSYPDLIQERYGIDVYNTSLEEVGRALRDNKLEVEKNDSIPRGIDKLWKAVRADLGGPTWVINEPKFLSPLAKTADDGVSAQRFHPIIAGTELGNGFSELNDPEDQLARFMEQQQMRDAGDQEAQMLDIDFVEMLEYGMPPACGWGHSERVFWIFEGVTAREGVPFPQLRREIDTVTRAIYPEIKFE
ncbi:OB-fold nucleic acid binding domain-containing protein [Candidatus Saccharibacteria bacterium]|nr:OB-fold nucleic acid binding domain-containing protein [Candidatus Saccharibacteria bacterium]